MRFGSNPHHKVVTDSKLTSVEIYNPHENHTVRMIRDMGMDSYLNQIGHTVGPLVAELAPKTRVLLPHQYYASFFKGSEELAPVLAIFGNDIGRGVTTASAPGLISS